MVAKSFSLTQTESETQMFRYNLRLVSVADLENLPPSLVALLLSPRTVAAVTSSVLTASLGNPIRRLRSRVTSGAFS